MIRVTFSTFDYEPVCSYYNLNKPKNWNPIEKLNRIEGGFCIKRNIENQTGKLRDENEKIKQLRWSNKKLIVPTGWYGFTKEEEKLLYDSLCFIYGSETVLLE